MNYFTRESRRGIIKVLGKKTDKKICKACKRNFNQKNYHVCQMNNFGIHRLRHLCKFCYNEDRNRRGIIKVLGKKTDKKICKACKRNFSQKNYHVCQTNNFGIHRLRHTCKFCYNEDRNRRRHMVIRFPKPKECQICSEEKILYVDHCHDTHQHRGWLCRSCNAALGHFKDSVEGLNKAIEYLEIK